MSYFPTSSSGSGLKMSSFERVVLGPYHDAGGYWASEMSKPSLGGEVRIGSNFGFGRGVEGDCEGRESDRDRCNRTKLIWEDHEEDIKARGMRCTYLGRKDRGNDGRIEKNIEYIQFRRSWELPTQVTNPNPVLIVSPDLIVINSFPSFIAPFLVVISFNSRTAQLLFPISCLYNLTTLMP